MDEEEIPKRIMNARMEGTKRQGQLRSRWLNEVKKYLWMTEEKLVYRIGFM